MKFKLIMIFICMLFINVGNYYCFDFPQIFCDALITKFGITTVEVEYLYSLYSIPNFIFAPLGGLILVYTGLGMGSLLFSSLIYASSIIILTGITYKSYWTIAIGRLVFGIGGETLIVAAVAIAERWFSGTFFSLAVGLCNVFNLVLGTTLAIYLGPLALNKERLLASPFFLLGIISFISWTFTLGFWLFEKLQLREDHDDEDRDTEELLLANMKFTLWDMKYFGKLYWLLVLVFVVFSNTYYQFINFITDFLMIRFRYSYLDAKNNIILAPLTSAITMPIFSLIVLYWGKKGILLFLAAVLAICSYSLLLWLPEKPGRLVQVSLVMVGTFYSLYTSIIWSAMSLVVPKEGTSIALSVATTLQNIFLTFLPVVFGNLNIKRTPDAYNHSLYLLIGMASLTALISFITFLVDLAQDKILHLSENHGHVTRTREATSMSWKNDKSSNTSLRSSMLDTKQTSLLSKNKPVSLFSNKKKRN